MAAGVAAERRAGRRMHIWYMLERDRVLGSLLLFPSVAYLAALVGYPLVLVFLLAFSDASTSSANLHFTGLDTFVSAIRDPVFLTSLKNTFIFTIVSQAIVVVLSFILANVLATNFRGKWFVRFLLLLPWTTPLALSAVAWLWMLDSQFSPLDWILSTLHVIGPHHYVAWLGQGPMVQGSIIAIDAWRLLPLATVIVLAGLTSIPAELKEQAQIDGAGFWRTLFGVTLPLLTPILSVALLFGIVATFTDMTAVYILTNGGPDNATQVLPSWAFTKGIQGGDLSGGAATALFMFPVLLALSILMLRRASRADVA